MCGIVGFTSTKFGDEEIELIKKLFIETQIRGKHASGLSFFNGKEIVTFRETTPSSDFIRNFDFNMLKEAFKKIGKLYLIGHIRYSTSDLLFNQPIGDENLVLAHNGVITQENPEQWKKYEKYFNFKLKTKNDSEILWNLINKNKDIIKNDFENFIKDLNKYFFEASMSVVGLNLIKGSYNSCEMFNFRNGLRPQWCFKDETKKVVASTEDILLRCGLLQKNIKKVSPSFGKENITRKMK